MLEKIDWTKWDRANCKVTDLELPSESQGKFARTIEGLLTKEECEAMIAVTEGIGYEPAMVNIGNGKQILDTQYRKSQRVIVDTVAVTDIIYKRLIEHIPDLFPETKFLGSWSPHCLNERLRFLRYDPGDFFQGHMDGTFRKSASETPDNIAQTSRVTL